VSSVPDWKIADVLDFESLLGEDARQKDETLRIRDHALYTGQIVPALPAEQVAQRRPVFLSWVNLRRSEADKSLPGQPYADSWQTLVTVSAVAGLIVGGSLTAGLLHYSGTEPINALLFLASTLAPQLLLLVGALLLWLERRTTRFLSEWRPLRALVAGLLSLLSAGMRRLSGEQRNTLQAMFGRLGNKRDIYGPLATWSFLIVTQVFAVCFNLGILGTLLAELPARELRFGWQTTLDVKSEEAARMVKAIAAPWSWAPNAHPTAEQVIQTRYAPGQGHRELPADATRAWWPFLFYAVVCYGLVVRGSLLLFSACRLRRNLKSLRFDHADANALWRRLTGPMVVARGGEARLPERKPEEPVATAATPSPPKEPGGGCLVLVAQEMTVSPEMIASKLTANYGWKIVGQHAAKIDNRKESAGLLASIRELATRLSAIAIIAPAGRDPIMAIGLFLKEVVSASGSKPEVLVLLTGEPTDEGFGPVDEARMEIWKRFRDIQGLSIGIERLP
jgi:hypothetical protein